MWKLDHKEDWVPKNWCFQTVVLEKTLESPSNSEEIKPVNPKGNQSWIFIGRTDAETEAPILWSPDAKSWLILKGPDAGKDWGQEEKGMAEDEMVRSHHWLNEHEFEQTQGKSEGLGVWANSGKEWRIGKSGMLQFVGLQRVIHNLVTEQQKAMCCLILFEEFCWGFLHPWSSVVLTYNLFLCVWHLCLVLISVGGGLVGWTWENSSLCNVLEEF